MVAAGEVLVEVGVEWGATEPAANEVGKKEGDPAACKMGETLAVDAVGETPGDAAANQVERAGRAAVDVEDEVEVRLVEVAVDKEAGRAVEIAADGVAEREAGAGRDEVGERGVESEADRVEEKGVEAAADGVEERAVEVAEVDM